MKKWWKESALRQQENGMEAIEGLLPEGALFPPLFHGIPPAAQLRSTRQLSIC